ncbi:class A basic helix-loop-helix protein 15 isoform X1 [Halichoeres trimaculatus]|uniref:class A basic helix-loop-helix protein 15 isoform X1 n=1 Tax=Halichoeres trimaculatus TaxID=147232 RepID=UPI003D9E5D2E
MSGASRMQEFKYCREGATLVISLDGLNWLSKRRCRDKRVKKRNEEPQLLMPLGQIIQTDEELQPIACLCVLDQKGSTALHVPRENRDCSSSLVTWPPPDPIPHQWRSLPEKPHLKDTSLASFDSLCPTEASWTRLILDMKDIFRLIAKGLNIVTQHDAATMYNRFIVFCSEDIPRELYSDIWSSEDCRTYLGDTGWKTSDDVVDDLQKSATNQLHNPITNSSEAIQNEDLQKSCQTYSAPRVNPNEDKKAKRRKSVSFVDDVMVCLFDQERPTMELHGGPCTPLSSSYSFNLPDVTLEDIGLEWEDDFSALEKNCHFQHVRHSQRFSFSLPTQSCTALSGPERFRLSQTCLFLTHVTESDLEL